MTLTDVPQVSSFYIAKEADLKARLKSLEDKKKVIKRNSKMQSKNAILSLSQAYDYFNRDLAKLQVRSFCSSQCLRGVPAWLTQMLQALC